MANMLGTASSPYLRQHRDNPVHWQVWGPAALAEAKARDLPILLSIGYAACHWCHVMAHESFEDEAVAKIMNARFVNIKVDREERPDIDQIYMTALHAMGEQGGWPLTMVLTPEGAPFWGGTYFPPTPRFGRPSFTQVLLALSAAWDNDRDRIGSTVASMGQALAANAAARPGDPPGPEALDAVRAAFLGNVDWQRGGLGQAPKFPNTPVFRFLWQEAFRTGERRAADAVDLLLDRMSQGGIYDHLGGGYARYATDDAWLIPHFEKMLYDNALILDLLALVHAATGNPLYAARARETVGWLMRDMREEGAFAASEDADSEGVEGKFYVWTAAEIRDALGADAALFGAHYDHAGARQLGRPHHPGAQDAARRRAYRNPPRPLHGRCCWSGGARGSGPAGTTRCWPTGTRCWWRRWRGRVRCFGAPDWLAAAQATFDFILRTMGRADGRIDHAYRAGTISAAGPAGGSGGDEPCRAGAVRGDRGGGAAGPGTADRGGGGALLRRWRRRFLHRGGGRHRPAGGAGLPHPQRQRWPHPVGHRPDGGDLRPAAPPDRRRNLARQGRSGAGGLRRRAADAGGLADVAGGRPTCSPTPPASW